MKLVRNRGWVWVFILRCEMLSPNWRGTVFERKVHRIY
jgi:hypothetical protein